MDRCNKLQSLFVSGRLSENVSTTLFVVRPPKPYIKVIKHFWVAVSSILYFHPNLRKWSNLTNIFFRWVAQPPTRPCWCCNGCGTGGSCSVVNGESPHFRPDQTFVEPSTNLSGEMVLSWLKLASLICFFSPVAYLIIYLYILTS